MKYKNLIIIISATVIFAMIIALIVLGGYAVKESRYEREVKDYMAENVLQRGDHAICLRKATLVSEDTEAVVAYFVDYYDANDHYVLYLVWYEEDDGWLRDNLIWD